MKNSTNPTQHCNLAQRQQQCTNWILGTVIGELFVLRIRLVEKALSMSVAQMDVAQTGRKNFKGVLQGVVQSKFVQVEVDGEAYELPFPAVKALFYLPLQP